METIIEKIKSNIPDGTLIPKPRKGHSKVKGWGRRRGEDALIYTIGHHGQEKGVTVSEWGKAFKHLTGAGDFTRAWFERSMPACADEGSCSFTTIGGIFVLLGWAAYFERGTYRKTR